MRTLPSGWVESLGIGKLVLTNPDSGSDAP